MKILWFIGNGFDMNLGMKTSYRNFYEYYKTIKSESELINNLKKDILDKPENWADLELTLGDYTKNIQNPTDLEKIYEDLQEKLAVYLNQQEENCESKFGLINSDRLLKDLIHPEYFLTEGDKNNLINYRKHSSTPVFINMISFNYTNSIENILGNKLSDTTLKDDYGREVKTIDINHIHGYTDSRMVMGVNDISQISNEHFKDNLDIIEAMVKPESNKTMDHTLDKKCENLVISADIICIFGCSLGYTDKFWWEVIAKKLLRGSLLIIFDHGDPIKERQSYKIGRRKRNVKDNFLSKTDLSDLDKGKISDKIFIGVNADIFDLVNT